MLMRAGGGDLLVFDENADTDKEVTGVLQSGSFDVRLCTSQSELFASIKSRKPALVLLSLTRAESSGLQTLKQLRESYATLPVVVVANDAATHQV
ncbi:MAG: hypothetical protein KDI36_12765, partial [Pseudomonadales bacterium]|nr:hypothetical protein [Pseudomonadales bacterium]